MMNKQEIEKAALFADRKDEFDDFVIKGEGTHNGDE
jgi:hypothetical protein